MVTLNMQVFGSSSAVPYIESVRIMRTEAKHDHATISLVKGPVSSIDNSLAGLPADIECLTSGIRLRLNGYLDVTSPARMQSVINSTVHMMGITSALRNSTARAWSNRLPGDIAAEVLDPYKLGLEVDAYTTPIEFISQADGESDWQLLARLADRIGFSLTNQDVVVRMIDVSKEERRTPYRSYETLTLPSSSSINKNVSAFSTQATGSPSDTGYKDMTIRGVDRLGQSFMYRPSFMNQTADLTPEFSALHSGKFVSLAQAEIEAARINRQARFTNVAQVQCIGFRDLIPGRCALVVDYDGEYGGFWYITDVTHHFNSTTQLSSTEATLCRDSIKGRVNQVPIKTHQGRYPNARLVNGSWQADRAWKKTFA